MSGLGKRLRNRREEMGLTLTDVEEKTKIRTYYISAIEQDNYSVLPDRIYVIGFLRSYSKLLNLDTTKVIDDFNELWPANEEELKALNSPEKIKKAKKIFGNKNNRIIRLIVLVGALILLIGINQLWNGTELFSPTNGNNIVVVPPEEEQDISNNKEPIEEPEPIFDNLTLEIAAVRGDCWLDVSVDGDVEYSQTLRKDQEKLIFVADEKIIVTFGNAGAVDVILNGKLINDIGEDVVRNVVFLLEQDEENTDKEVIE